MDTVTSVNNPIKEISSLLGDALKDNDKREPETDSAKEEQETASPDENLEEVESQSSDESLSEDQDESQDQGIESLNNLAEELDIPIEDMYALGVKIPKSEAFPEGGDVSLGELKDFYTKNINIDQERTALKEREQQLEVQAEQVSEVPKISNELLQARAQVLAIQDAYNRTDWAGLRHTNQAEYAALQQDFRSQFEAAKYQESIAAQQFEDHQLQNQKIQQERLFEIMPELKDEKVRADTVTQITAFASKYGITPKEIDTVSDHRIMRLLIDSSRSETAKVKAKSKQVEKKAPKTTKPTVKQSIPGRKAALKRLTDKAKAARATNRDKAEAIAHLLG